MNFTGKVVLVTGAGSGIGSAIANRFAADGAKVVFNYHSEGRHADDAKRMAKDVGALALPADVSLRSEVDNLVKETVSRLGRLDIVVNNAGIEIIAPVLDLTEEQWQKVLNVNLTGPFLVAQAAARQMISQAGEGGKIINVSSVHEDIPFPHNSAYCSSKGGLRMLMRCLALELAPHRINVNNIAPGAVATPINQSLLEDPAAKANAIREIPWGRFGRPEEVAAVAAFLASDEASYVTGSTYYVDGGLTQQVSKY